MKKESEESGTGPPLFFLSCVFSLLYFFRALFFPVFPAVLRRGGTHGFFEHFGKVVHIQNAHLLGHGGNALVGIAQDLGRTADALGVEATPHNTTPTKENILGAEQGQGCALKVFARTN